MPLAIQLANLASRVKRKAIAGQAGIRRFAESGVITRTSNNVTETFWDGLARFGASLLTTLTWKPPWMNINFVAIFNAAVQGFQFIFNFNINATDKELDEQIKQAEIALAGAKGAAKGRAVGTLICGIAPAATIAVFNEPLALHVLKNVGEEAAEELAQKIATVVQMQIRQTARIAFVNFFKNNRALVRNAILGGAKFSQLVGVPFSDEEIEKADKKRDQPWSLASSLEESIDNIKDPVLRSETEEFWEEFGEACIENGYIVAGSLDSWFLQQKVDRDAAELRNNEDIIIINPSGSISEGTAGTT